jgi:hypothetical protein
MHCLYILYKIYISDVDTICQTILTHFFKEQNVLFTVHFSKKFVKMISNLPLMYAFFLVSNTVYTILKHRYIFCQ